MVLKIQAIKSAAALSQPPQLADADSVLLLHAERILKDQLRQRGWTEAELSCRRKGDPEKVRIATQLRAQTTMTLKWIAQRLEMVALETVGFWTCLRGG